MSEKTTPEAVDLIRKLPLKAQTRAYEHLLAGMGMPAELQPCGTVSFEQMFSKTFVKEMTPLNLLADLLEDQGMSAAELLAAAKNNPEELRRFIDANLPGMCVN